MFLKLNLLDPLSVVRSCYGMIEDHRFATMVSDKPTATNPVARGTLECEEDPFAGSARPTTVRFDHVKNVLTSLVSVLVLADGIFRAPRSMLIYWMKRILLMISDTTGVRLVEEWLQLVCTQPSLGNWLTGYQ